MILREVAARRGLDYEGVTARPAAAGIEHAEGESLRDIAGRAGMSPSNLGALVTGSR